MTEVAEECDVSTRQIEQWIRDERLVIADDSPIGITCERCKNKMDNNLGSMYGESNAAVEHMEKRLSSADAKMRFLDKN